MTIKQRLFRTLILCCLGLLIGAGIALTTVMAERSGSTATSSKIVNAAGIGGPYTLIDQDGVTRTEADFKNTYKLIYFGFTFCPAICPTELQKIAQALKSLPDDIRAKIQPIFITIDPERDTPAVMKKYVPMFDPRLIGLTGSVEQIEAVKKAYKIYGAKVPPAEGAAADEYTMDHSSFFYFMTPDDQMISIYKTEDLASDMVEQLTEYFKAH